MRISRLAPFCIAVYLFALATLNHKSCEACGYDSGDCGCEQAMNEPDPTWIDILRILCSGLIGGIIGAVVNDFLSRRREQIAIKRHFVGRISSLKSAADIIEDFEGWFARSKPTIEQECAIVESAIRSRWHNQFVIARNKYANAQRKDIEDFDNATLSIPKTMTYQRGRLMAIDLLQQLIACASN